MNINIFTLILKIAGPLLTIIGMFATFFITRYTCKKDIEKIKKEKSIEKIIDIPAKALNYLYDISKNIDSNYDINKYTDEWSKIVNAILAYGSKDAIKICSYIQEQAYLVKNKNWHLLCAFSILISQMKNDITGEIISPEFYFKLKITDYEKSKDKITKIINEIITNLKLNKKFLINIKNQNI